MAVFPSREELEGMQTIEQIRAWCGRRGPCLAALEARIGEFGGTPGNLAMLPPDIWKLSVAEARVGEGDAAGNSHQYKQPRRDFGGASRDVWSFSVAELRSWALRRSKRRSCHRTSWSP